MSNSFPFDSKLQLKDAGAVTASAAATVATVAAVLDLGGPDDGAGIARTEAALVIDVSANDGTSANETYVVEVEVATDTAFTAPIDVIHIPIPRSTTGRTVHVVSNEKFGTTYRYMRLFTTVGGTTPSINYTAYLSILGRTA